jgi:hypothetical protein
VCVGDEAPQLGARAFALGSSLFFAPGAYDPGSDVGLGLLAHELSHVVQQKQGRASGAAGAEATVLHDEALEAEADHVAALIVSGSGARVPGIERRDAQRSFAARPPVLQLQKYGLREKTFINRTVTVGPADAAATRPAARLALGAVQADVLVEFSQTASQNEFYDQRATAWARALEISGLSATAIPKRVYYIAPGQPNTASPNIGAVEQAALMGRCPNANTIPVWVKRSNIYVYDTGELGFYHDFGDNTMIIEHLHDPNGTVTLYAANLAGVAVTPIKHFHSGAYQGKQYIAINAYGNVVNYGGRDIQETAQINARAGYQTHGSHHIGYRT